MEGYIVAVDCDGYTISKWGHSHLKEAATTRYLSSVESQLFWRRSMITYLESKPLLWSRTLSELPWHLVQCAALTGGEIERNKLIALLSRLDVVNALLTYFPSALLMYWKFISSTAPRVLTDALYTSCVSTHKVGGNSMNPPIAVLFLAEQLIQVGDMEKAREICESLIQGTLRSPYVDMKAHRTIALIHLRTLQLPLSLNEITKAEKVFADLSPELQRQKKFGDLLCDCRYHRAHVLELAGQISDELIILEDIAKDDRLVYNPLLKAHVLSRTAYARIIMAKTATNISSIADDVLAMFDDAIGIANKYHHFHLAVDIRAKKLSVQMKLNRVTIAEYDDLISTCVRIGNSYTSGMARMEKANFLHTRLHDTTSALQVLQDALEEAYDSQQPRVLEIVRTNMANYVTTPQLGSECLEKLVISIPAETAAEALPKRSPRPMSAANKIRSDVATNRHVNITDIPAGFTGKFTFEKNVVNIGKILDAAAKRPAYAAAIRSEEGRNLVRAVDLLVPVHGCRVSILKKICESGAILSHFRAFGAKGLECELFKTLRALLNCQLSMTFFIKYGFENDCTELNTALQSLEEAPEVDPGFEGVLMLLAGRLRLHKQPDSGNYEKARIKVAREMAKDRLSDATVAASFDADVEQLLAQLPNDPNFCTLSYDFGYSFSVRNVSLGNKGSHDNQISQSDTLYALMGANAHFGGASLVLSPHILSHPGTRIVAPGELTVVTGRVEKTHPFLLQSDDEEDDSTPEPSPPVRLARQSSSLISGRDLTKLSPRTIGREKLFSNMVVNASAPGWNHALARVVATAARLFLGGALHAHGTKPSPGDVKDEEVFPWYNTHDLFFQKEYNIEAHLPPMVPLALVNHILLVKEHVDITLLTKLRDTKVRK